MESGDLRIIRAIRDAGSITRAAERLRISQPTLSRRLGRLEQRLGARLFLRSPAGLVSTEVADFVIRSAEPVEAQLQRIERHVRELAALEAGEVRIGVGPIVEQVLLPEVLSAFVARTGDVRISIRTEPADDLVRDLRAAELDLVAGPLRVGDHADLQGVDLISDHMVTVARAGHPLFEHPGPVDLERYPFASPPRQGAVTGGALPRVKRIESDDYGLLRQLVLTSDCICGGPRRVFESQLADGSLVLVEGGPRIHWTSACMFRPESRDTPLVALLVELLCTASERYVAGARAPAG